jgi:hypothetical protein
MATVLSLSSFVRTSTMPIVRPTLTTVQTARRSARHATIIDPQIDGRDTVVELGGDRGMAGDGDKGGDDPAVNLRAIRQATEFGPQRQMDRDADEIFVHCNQLRLEPLM